MDIPNDFIVDNTIDSGYIVGDLVAYIELFSHSIPKDPHNAREGDIGIVTRIGSTYLGYTVYHVLWLRSGLIQTIPYANLKIAYLDPAS
jgi:hypothetical protein